MHHSHAFSFIPKLRLQSLKGTFIIFFFSFSFWSFYLFRATLMAHGGSQARGPIRVVAAGLRHSHSNAGSEPRLPPTPHLRQRRILNPMSEVRDGTCVLMDAGWVR